MTRSPAADSSAGTLGTFAGVFAPSILTILGIILFLRLGFVVGSAGLGRALLIIGISATISILTTISLSAVATNIKVKGGGAYYLISRTLGVEFGGAIGIVLFIANAVSIAFYCVGFAEAVNGLYPDRSVLPLTLIAALAVVFLFLFAWLGADWATRLQYLTMAIVGAALLSFAYGSSIHWNHSLLAQNWTGTGPDLGFGVLFAIFFPAITGFTQGMSMSGDLRDTGKSLPLGTFAAVGLSLIVYFGAAVLFAGSLPGAVLVDDYQSMKRLAHYGWLIDAGLIAATLSSAMASFLGGPRILQSLATDRIFPFLAPFGVGVGANGNPRRAVLLSGAIALITLALGNLNFIAALVSMFFLLTYALLNYATYFEARAASPSFRPRFRFFHARVSLLGALGSFGAMIAIDPAASGAALAVLFAIHQYLKRTAGPARWADSARSHHFQRIRESLFAMDEDPAHSRDWRPCILAFCDEPSRRERLLKFASWIEGGSGLTTAVNIIEGDDEKALRLRDKADQEIRQFIAERELEVFPRVIMAPDFRSGVESLIQSFGIGGIRANMVLLSRLDQVEEAADNDRQIHYGRELHEAIRLRCNVVVFDADAAEWSAVERLDDAELRIDVWWWGDRTSQLMLLLAYLMTRSQRWSDATVRVFVPGSRDASEKTLTRVRQLLQEIRIDAEPEVVVDVDADTVVRHSRDASLVFFPLRYREMSLLSAPRDQISVASFVEQLPMVALTLAAEDIDLGAGPDEGKAAEVAKAVDAAEEAEKAARKAEDEAERLALAAQKEIEARAANQPQPGQVLTGTAKLAQAQMAAQLAVEAWRNAEAAAAAAADVAVDPVIKK